jgi:hypothetical protein
VQPLEAPLLLAAGEIDEALFERHLAAHLVERALGEHLPRHEHRDA